MPDVTALYEWLVDAAPGATSAPEVARRFGEGLVDGGVPVDRMTVFVSTLHPTVYGRAFVFEPSQETVVHELPHDFFARPVFTESPIYEVTTTGGSVRERLSPGPGPRKYAIYDELAGEGHVDYVALPMVFTSGEIHVASFATKRPSGFSEEDIACIRRALKPLARLAEILALRRTSVNLLSTYVGHNSGERILAGRIQRGDVETIRAVIWFSDLRGFTELSARSTAEEVIAALNVAFDCQVRAVERRGGEVLKFMGDGMLAIFPLTDQATATETCDAALDAADGALADLAARSVERGDPLRIGLALHLGELAYGNIGGADRLDFTAIGAAVNMASRLEGLTSRLGRGLVVSRDFARTTTRACESVGVFDLKGVPEPAEVFAPEVD